MARVMLIPMTLYPAGTIPSPASVGGGTWAPDYLDEIPYKFRSQGNARDFMLCEVEGAPTDLAALAARLGVVDLGDDGASVSLTTRQAVRTLCTRAGVRDPGAMPTRASAFRQLQDAILAKQQAESSETGAVDRDAIEVRLRASGRWRAGERTALEMTRRLRG